MLRGACATRHHEFWSCALSITDERWFDHARVHSPKQVTDAYLLVLAVQRGGRFVTFDKTVPLSAVRSASEEHLTVLK